MRDIYMPNLLRIENLKIAGNGFSELEYFLNFDMEDNYNFKALVSIQLANLLENMILFDMVYIDLIELPLFLKELVCLDKESVNNLFDKATISYIDFKDLRVGVYEKDKFTQDKYTKSEENYTLAAYGFSIKFPKTQEEFEEFILTYFKNDIEKYQRIKPYLKFIYESRKQTQNSISGEELVKSIDLKLKSGDFSFLGIGGNNYYFITEKNKYIYNVICRLCRDNYIASKFELYTYYKEDILEVLAELMNETNIAYNFEFFKISDINKIPDFRKMFIEGKINLKDISKIISNKNISNFRNWFFNNIEDGKNIEKEFVELLKKSPSDNVPLKIARFLIPNILGAIPIYGTFIGMGLSVVDSFILDNVLEDSSLKFLNKYSKITSKNKSVNDNEQGKWIQIPLKSEILIDNSLSGDKAIIDSICKTLRNLENDIDFSNDDIILRIFLTAKEISGKYWRYKIVLERFMYLCVKLTEDFSKYIFVIVKMLEDLYNVVKVIETFTFAKEYYFQGYYNLFNILEKKELHIDRNPYIVFNDEVLNSEYEKYLKEKLKF